MTFSTHFTASEPSRADVDAWPGATVIEFGTGWCGYCLRAQPLIANVLGAHPDLKHIKVEDGPGLPLGRSFRIKLWPSLIFLRDGQEVARVVRPQTEAELKKALATLDAVTQLGGPASEPPPA